MDEILRRRQTEAGGRAQGSPLQRESNAGPFTTAPTAPLGHLRQGVPLASGPYGGPAGSGRPYGQEQTPIHGESPYAGESWARDEGDEIGSKSDLRSLNSESIGGVAGVTEALLPVGKERIAEFDRILTKYKAGKSRLEQRVIAAEQWWKLRNTQQARKEGAIGWDKDFRAKSGWLHSVIASKHADAMENYPEPVILPREPGDRQQARILSAVLPTLLEQQHFGKTYDEVMWQKLKTGTGVYQITWDADANGGIGDISIKRVDLLHLFWEPGITDIQDSRYLFHAELVDTDLLEQQYPQLRGKGGDQKITLSKYIYDDTVSTDGKSLVVDVYYKVQGPEGKTVLHYCKYVGDTILYATENGDGRGLYDHGRYPFVLDPLWPIEGSPCGYGFVDLCANTQIQIDLMDTAFLKNTMVGATPRYLQRGDGGINESELMDLSKAVIHVAGGTLDETMLRVVDYKPLGGAYINVYESKIAELRETSGNTDTANGISNGVTAASAIAALQEAGGKTSRDSTQASYRAYTEIIEMCIELIRQFYTLPRQFRIVGQDGQQDFLEISNAPMQPQMVSYGAVQMGYASPIYDVKVKAQKRNAYSRLSQNELALQLYQLGFFAPEQATPAMAALSMMEFEGKEEIQQQVERNGTLLQMLQDAQSMILALLAKYEPQRAQQYAQSLQMQQGAADSGGQLLNFPGTLQHPEESAITAKARDRASKTTEVQG